MEQEPKNHTIVYGISYVQSTGEMTHISQSVLYYKHYSSFNALPITAQSPETEQEYNAWWDWYKKYGYSEL